MLTQLRPRGDGLAEVTLRAVLAGSLLLVTTAAAQPSSPSTAKQADTTVAAIRADSKESTVSIWDTVVQRKLLSDEQVLSAVAEDPVDEQDHDHEIDPKLLERLAATTHDIYMPLTGRDASATA